MNHLIIHIYDPKTQKSYECQSVMKALDIIIYLNQSRLKVFSNDYKVMESLTNISNNIGEKNYGI